MTTVTATSAELVRVLEEAGTAFGWSRAYESVLATAIGAAYQAAGLDEATDAIGVSPADVKEVTAAITDSAAVLGRAPRTATAYGAAWRRIAEIAHRWRTAGGQDPDNRFWDTRDHVTLSQNGEFLNLDYICHDVFVFHSKGVSQAGYLWAIPTGRSSKNLYVHFLFYPL